MSKKGFSSKFFLVIIISYTSFISFQNKRWHPQSIIHDDAINYYAYLPAAFIYHDLTFSFVDSIKLDSEVKVCRPITADNRVVQKMTMGVSVMLLPFFGAAHLISVQNQLPTNGYTEEYELFIAIAALFYFALGLFYLRKSLKKYFNETIVSVTILVIGLSTNLFYYATYESGYSHVYSFCLFSIFLWLTIQWHEKPSVKFSVLSGLVLGLITLIRPSNCLVSVFFVLYGITSVASIGNIAKMFKEKWQQVLLIGFFAFLIVLLQMVYWKFASGNWLYYSYGEEHFYFSHPHIWEGLFGFRKGFFIYTPVMILIFPGLWVALKQHEKYGFALLVFFIINVYVIFSWWCWWYGGGFGSRPLVESYPLLALALGTLFSKCFNYNLLRRIISGVIIFFIILNLFQTDQAERTVLHCAGMNSKLYFLIFGKEGFPENYDLIVSEPDNENAFKGLPERDILNVQIEKSQPLSTFTINVKANNNKFMCADKDKNNMILCNRDDPYESEIFEMSRYYGNICTISLIKRNMSE